MLAYSTSASIPLNQWVHVANSIGVSAAIGGQHKTAMTSSKLAADIHRWDNEL